MSDFTARNAMLDILLRVEKDKGFSHLLIDHQLRSGKVNVKDEALLTEVVYGTLQRKYTLDYYLERFVDAKKKIAPWVRMLLRMSVYQMVFLDRIPDHAIIHEAVEIAKEHGHKGTASFVNGVLRNVQRKGVADPSEITDQAKRLSVMTSHPMWLVKRWISFYGYETTEAMCQANLQHKNQSIRIQPLRINREEAMKQLQEQQFDIRPSKFSAQGIIIDKGNILKSNLFKEGMVTVQDQTSMLAAEMLDPETGMQILDACSAPGGKTTHIAEKMKNKGKIHAYDLHRKKVKLVEQKAAELNLTIIEAKPGDARNLREEHEDETFDRILIDAPCSGLGVIRGKPEIKYDKQEEDVERLAQIQLDIIRSVAPLLKKGGKLLYSTCTVDMKENEDTVKQFLEGSPAYELDPDFRANLPEEIRDAQPSGRYGLQIFPQTFGTDGFFLTRMIRKK
ncbi:16S rRNA (cytosine(967)-C(5))-methyltransferase RsmB [Lentibacillus sediminis]|uniref:16S rRNA (cytosine(967)-C(5))-methyltransferase RsmB n=1 Tax=Lentibacillus sediminis TaxID=1940529 RepID=UPI000C1C70DA|nr:16S rRNA (cytosine(967)-C(5))-methyltransferase RsmB [Lentibacillus sediminis]